MPDDLRASLLAGTRLMAAWACVSVGVLDLSMGIDPAPGSIDGPYLLFHLVLLAGGTLLLGLGRLPKSPTPLTYGVAAALAVLATAVTALPRTRTVCCQRDLDVRHGYPLTLLASDRGRPGQFAAGHAVADLIFWFLVGLLVLALIVQLQPRRPAPDPVVDTGARPEDVPARASRSTEAAPAPVPADPAAPVRVPEDPAAPVRVPEDPAAPVRVPEDPAAPVRDADIENPAARPTAAEGRSSHAEERATAERATAPVADDENVGGLP